MSWFLIVLLVFLAFILLVIFSKLTVIIRYEHRQQNDDLKIEFRIWFGLIKYKKNIPFIKIDEDSPAIITKSHSQIGDSPEMKTGSKVNEFSKDDLIISLKNTKELLKRVVSFHSIVKHFLSKISIKKLEWHSMVGAGDAAHTGVLTGVIWALKGSIVGMLSHYFRLKVMPEMSVIPHFQGKIGQTKFQCIFQFRIGHAMLAGLKMIKFWKGGRPHFKSNFSKEKMKSV